MTTLEILDALEAGIAALRSGSGIRAANESFVSPEELRKEAERWEISVAELAEAVQAPAAEVRGWFHGAIPAPVWLLSAIRLISLLPMSARRRFRPLDGPAAANPQPIHPFSRIEDL